MDKNVLERLKSFAARLQTPVCLMNAQGEVLPVTGGFTGAVPDPWPEDGCAEGSWYFLLSRSGERLLWAAGAGQEACGRDIALLMDQALLSVLGEARESGEAGAYKRLLTQRLSRAEAEALADRHHIPLSLARTVYLLQLQHEQRDSACQALQQVIPMNEGDALIPLDHRTAALLQVISRQEDDSDPAEFARAVQESVLSETGNGLTIAIGETAQDLYQLYDACRQAQRAMEIGRVFCGEESIYDYRSMLLPRFLSELSPETAEHYHKLLFNESTSRLFNDEMLKTIQVFFQKDLNLSDTARQLYIHRNTLVYRLDKVLRETGLDLRRFDDAVTFRMLMEMDKCKDQTVPAEPGTDRR